MTGWLMAGIVLLAGNAAQEASWSDARSDSVLVLLSTDVSNHDARCPVRTRQFTVADERADPAWARENLVGWDPAAIRTTVEDAYQRSSAEIPIPGTIIICVALAAPSGREVIARMQGIAGGAYQPRTIALYVTPAQSPEWLEHLPFTVAHEYHHLAAPTVAASGLDVLVREGKAHYFAWTLYPELLHPSAAALAPEDLPAAYATIAQHLEDSPGGFTREYMFGGEYFGGRVPRWAGYTLAFEMLRAYAARFPDRSLAELAAADPREVWASWAP